MSVPRPVLPDKTYLVTRRVTQRQFLLTPCAVVNEVLLYSLAYASQQHGIELHAFCALSNHLHLVLTDVRGNLPEFMCWFCSVVARALNRFHRRSENFWSNEKYSRVELLSREDVFAKIAYVLANPVAAGLVERSHEWPGVISRPFPGGSYRLRVKRPKHFFRPGGLPEEVELTVRVPRGEFGAERQYGQELRQMVTQAEREKKRERRQTGRRVLGRQAVLRQQATARPRLKEPRGRLSPTVASGGDRWRRMEYLQRSAEWLRAYREALEEKRRGGVGVLFPWGTWWWCRWGGERCGRRPGVARSPPEPG